MRRDCPLVVHWKKRANDAKQGCLVLGAASYLPRKWWRQAREPWLPDADSHWVFFPFTASMMTDGLVLQFENIFFCLHPHCNFVYVSRSSKWNKIHFCKTNQRSLISVKFEKEAFMQKWNLLRRMGWEDSAIKYDQSLSGDLAREFTQQGCFILNGNETLIKTLLGNLNDI